MKLERTIEQYRNGVPAVIVKGSEAQVLFALEDSRKDILTMDAEITRLRAENEELRAEEIGTGGTLGSTAVGHMREMYRKAYDALGPSGRTSLRNFINARADRIADGAADLGRAEAFERAAQIADEAKEMRERLFAENGASINASKAAQAEAIAADIRAEAGLIRKASGEDKTHCGESGEG